MEIKRGAGEKMEEKSETEAMSDERRERRKLSAVRGIVHAHARTCKFIQGYRVSISLSLSHAQTH